MKPFNRTIEIPYSKSYLNRLLILAAVKKGTKLIQNYSPSSDVDSLIHCLQKIGLSIKIEKNNLVMEGSFPECELSGEPLVLDTKDGGTTLRFLISLLSLGKRSYIVNFSHRMGERPLQELIEILQRCNVNIQKADSITIKGPIQLPESLEIDCSRSSQFASSLALSFYNKTKIVPLNLKSSQKYFELTNNLIKSAESNQYIAKADWSSASYPLALAMFEGEVLIKNLTEVDIFQADSCFFTLLKSLGANISIDQNGLHLVGVKSFPGFKMDASQCLDLVPTLSFLASYASSPSFITGIKNLTLKESDRLSEIFRILTAFKVQFKYLSEQDCLEISGNSPLVEFLDFKSVDDHRMIMMCHLFMMKNMGGSVNHRDSVKKSFPNFFELLS
jgi:3-phosphoshikimate 1-carboxyvinyltransferase